MRVRAGGWLAVPLVTGLIVSGCGGGSSSTNASTAPPKAMTRSQFIEEANALCLAAEMARGRVIQSAAKRLAPGAKLTRAEQEVLIETAMVPYKELVKQFEQLGAPKGDAVQVRAITGALRSGVSAVQGNPGAAVTSSAQFEEFNRLAAKYGLHACRV